MVINKTWYDEPIVLVRNNNVDLALKLLRNRIQNAEVFKHIKKRRKNGLLWQRRRYKRQQAEEKKGLKLNT